MDTSYLQQIGDSAFVRLADDDVIDVNDVYHNLLFLQKNPLVYFKEVLGTKFVIPKLRDITNHVVDNKFTFVKSGHGVGKTKWVSDLAVWFLETHEDSLVYTTAPGQRQVTDLVWKELHKLKQNSAIQLSGKLLANKLKINEDWQISGFTGSSGVAYQGRHAKHLLWILDEADGISGEIWEAILSTISGEQNKLVAIGNPINGNSKFRQMQEKYPDDTFSISSYDSPNIVKIKTEDGVTYKDDIIIHGCATLSFIEDWRKEFGEDSNEFKGRILGEYGESAESSILSRQEVVDCFKVEAQPREWIILGIDIAYEGDDYSAITALSGNAFYRHSRRLQGLNGEKLVNETINFIDEVEKQIYTNEETGFVQNMKVKGIVYDEAGIATAFKEFAEKKFSGTGINLLGVNFGGKVSEDRVKRKVDNAHLMFNKRAEMYFDFRREVRNRNILIPRTLGLEKELPNMKYFTNSSGMFQMESKQEIKKRIKKELGRGKSPDTSDACVLALHGKILGVHLKQSSQITS